MSSPYIYINQSKIGADAPPYIVAELSANHNGSLETALELIRQAKKCGANAVKLQSYTPDTLTIDSDREDFQIKTGLWKGRKLYDLYKWAHMPWEWHKPLFEKARELEIDIFSTPFDKSAVDLLEDLNTPAYKIASFEIVDLKLIAYAASSKKPLIISTGMASKEEIAMAVQTAEDAGCRDIVLLHCVSGYPAPPEDYNLRTIEDMKESFGRVTGLSDHTLDNTTALGSIALGAALIEKHFSLTPGGKGPDDSFSIGPEQLEDLCRDAKNLWKAMGHVNYQEKSSEKESMVFRRSLYYVKDAEAGELIDESIVRSIRPGYGLKPACLDSILGRRLKKKVLRGEAVSLEDIEIEP